MNYSVLMTVYQRDDPNYLKMAIDSMISQTVLTDDFVIVCDGPLTNELEETLAYYTSKYSFFSIIRLEKNSGLGYALSKGLIACKNQLVARMDDDDISTSKRCESEINEFIKNKKLDICGSAVFEFENDIDSRKRIKRMPSSHNDIVRFSKRRNPFNHSSVMLKKDRIIGIGNYKPLRTNQDVELWVRALNNGLIGYNIEEPLVFFRFDSKTYKRRKDKQNIKLMVSLWRDFYKKGYCKRNDYLNVKIKQQILRLLPLCVIRWCYNHLR